MDMPPTRYRVVERGRRLEVIDTRPTRHAMELRPDFPLPAPEARTRSDTAKRSADKPALTMDSHGNRVIATATWFDAKGPRRIAVAGYHAVNMADKARALMTGAALVWFVASVLFAPLWLLPLVLAVPKVRRALRAWLTLWFDKLDQASTASSVG